MKSLLGLDHLISGKINGIIAQIFALLIAYLALVIIQAIVRMWSLAEIVNMLRNGVTLLSCNIGHTWIQERYNNGWISRLYPRGGRLRPTLQEHITIVIMKINLFLTQPVTTHP